MPVTLNYDLKRSMAILTKGDRWNVLTVLMLHTNVRNRCYPSMDTIAEMATGKNRNRATKAKTWLLKHGAINLVEYAKRVDDEARIPNRQHVYQLTGHWYACFEIDCDCGSDGAQYLYLYQGSQGQSAEDTERLEDEFHRMNGSTMAGGHSIPEDTMKTGHRMNGHRMNGDTLSISSISSSKEEKKEREDAHEAQPPAQPEISLSPSKLETEAEPVLTLEKSRDVTPLPVGQVRKAVRDTFTLHNTPDPIIDAYLSCFKGAAKNRSVKSSEKSRESAERIAEYFTTEDVVLLVTEKIKTNPAYPFGFLEGDLAKMAAEKAAPATKAQPTASYHRYTRINPDTGETETSDAPFTAYSDDLPEAS